MKKLVRRILFCFLLAVLVWCGTLIADRQMLREELIRLHVVASSDAREDQERKIRVRNAVMSFLRAGMADIEDVEQAKDYLLANLERLEMVANEVLRAVGCDDTAKVSLGLEAFPARSYDTFTLPSGVYQALRITIGEGQGENWWCVVFPDLCIGAATGKFADAAVGAGFPEGLGRTLSGDGGYGIRFFLLDAMGRLENFLCGG